MFLQKQKDAGKIFCFSHDPMITLDRFKTIDSAMELEWLRESYGITKLTRENFPEADRY
jgi:hypothetical protein